MWSWPVAPPAGRATAAAAQIIDDRLHEGAPGDIRPAHMPRRPASGKLTFLARACVSVCVGGLCDRPVA